MKPRALAATLALGLAALPAASAPMGAGVEPVTVLTLESEFEFDFAAKTFTNALRQQVLDAPDYTIGGESPMLYLVAREAKCSLKLTRGHPLDERNFDESCLRKIAKHLGIERFFWGFVAAEGGRPVVRLHLWQDGQIDRAASLPYHADQRDRIAERLYRKLVTPTAVGDLTVSGASAGDLFVDGKPVGTYAPSTELTLEAGLHEIEVRQGEHAIARVRTRVEPGGRSETQLAPVAEPAPSSPLTGPIISPPITVRPKASAWPWVLGGVGVAGLAGAGVFWGLRASELGDLEGSCAGRVCTTEQQHAVDRADRYGTFSALSLGVGVAGAGLAAYLLVARREPRVVGAVVPVAGGAVVGVGGAF